MLGDLETDEVRTQRFECRQRDVLVRPDQTRVANHVSSHNGGEAAFHADSPVRKIKEAIAVNPCTYSPGICGASWSTSAEPQDRPPPLRKPGSELLPLSPRPSFRLIWFPFSASVPAGARSLGAARSPLVRDATAREVRTPVSLKYTPARRRCETSRMSHLS